MKESKWIKINQMGNNRKRISKMKKINKVQEKNYSWENANKREEKEKVEKGRTIN